MKFLPFAVLPSRHRAGGPHAALFWLAAWVALFLSLPALARPTASTTVVISQVYGGGGNSGAPYTNDFIELHNVSGTNIDLTGYSVQYAAAGGNSWQVTTLSGTIRAGGFYLIQQAAGTTVTNAPLPTADATGSINLSGTSGKVALVSNATALTGTCPTAGVVDFVGFGGSTSTASFCFEGAGPTAAPSNTTSVLRKNSGCQDTDSNSADFATGTPTPRNSATGNNYYCVTAAGTISPTSGQAGTVLTINGGLLSAITSVTVAGVAATNVTATASTVTATVATGTPLGVATVVLSDGTNSYTAGSTFTVTTTSLSTPTLSATAACPGGTVGVTFTATGTYDPANVFTVELSDASGTFPTTPSVVGSAANATTTAQTITATLPAATTGGTAYRLRVVASNPATTSAPSAALTVNTVRVTPTAPQNIYTATTGTALTAAETGTPTGRQWAYATASGGPYTDLSGQTGPSYTPAFSTAGTYYVVVKSTFACGVQLSNEVVVNVSVAQLPTITSFSPSAGPAGTTVLIQGTNFIAGATVAFNGTPAAQVTLVSANQLRAVAPNGVTSGPLTVTTAGGSATSTASFTVSARTLALVDDFNRADNPDVTNGWTETETTATGATITSNQLRLSGAASGREFITRNIATRYSPELGSNERVLTWAWNMQQSRTNPSGFDAVAYGAAFVLAASNANLLTGTGYAVVVGNGGTPDPIKLVRFSNGFSAGSSLTDILVGTTDASNKAQTIRVTYLPDEDTWTLEVGTTTTAFQDPSSANTVYSTIGSVVDGTYTGSSLPYVGCLWNHATSATDYALFDNIYLTAPCLAEVEPTAGPTAAQASNLTSSGATLSWAAGTGNSRLVVVRPGTTGAEAPADGTSYPASAAYGRGALVGTATYAVYQGAGSTVAVTGLSPSTTYSYSVYEATGAGCSLNYLQAAPASGTFTTPACVVATAPTLPASAAQATAASSYALNLSWAAGNGSARLVVVRAGQPVVDGPQNATAYQASARLGAGTAIGAGFVVYSGVGTSVSVTGLSPNTTYYVAVYEFNGSGCSTAYLGSGAPTAQATTPAQAAAGTFHFYRGNLHAHSDYSDGNKDASTSGASTPADDYALARTAQQFDFMGISEHNHTQAEMDISKYAPGLAQADAATVDGTFVALYGMEWGTISSGGHVVIYGYNKLIGWEPNQYDVYVPKGNYTVLFDSIAQKPGAIAYLAHPASTDFNGLFNNPLNPRTAEILVGSAMRSGPAFSTNTTYSNPSTSTYEARFKDALRQGYHVAPTIDHDSHYSVFGRSTPGRLVLLAPELTRPALLNALQQRRFYASDDFNTEVTFQLGTQPMGSLLTSTGVPTLNVTVNDPDANDAVASIALFSGIPGSSAQASQVATSAGSATLTFTDSAFPDGGTYYYYAVITQADGDKMWTAPIRYTRSDAQGTPLPVKLLRFQATLQNEDEAVLRWATASEHNSAYFAVERSLDGQHFSEAGRLGAAGTTTQAHTYELRDPRRLTGLTYYRLRQVDLDGTATYSPVVTLAPTAREAAQVNVYPNPSAGAAVARLALRGLDGKQVSVRVVDMLGRTVATRQLIPLGYQADAPLALPDNLPAGMYVVTVATATQTWSLRWTLEPR
jgi:hypothetical protein